MNIVPGKEDGGHLQIDSGFLFLWKLEGKEGELSREVGKNAKLMLNGEEKKLKSGKCKGGDQQVI